ncbi:MAG: RimK family alpha-L-glutamate ligase [Candidatus Diapherotrites archaeon]
MSGKSLAIIAASHYNKQNNKVLIAEAEKAFDKVLFAPINRLMIAEEKGESKLLFKGINLLEFDACYPRFGSKDYFMGEAILRILDNSKIYTPVSLKGFQLSNHKFYSIKKLAEAGLPTLLTSLSSSPDVVKKISAEFDFPLVLKLINGFAGKGVMLINDNGQLKSILDTVHLFEEYISTQKYVESNAIDFRCYVFGEKVLTVKRTGAKDDWRANISRGGKAEIVPDNKKMSDAAIKASKILGFDICAIDFIQTKSMPEGFAIIEANFQPGPFRKFLGNTVPKEMMEFIRAKAEKARK